MCRAGSGAMALFAGSLVGDAPDRAVAVLGEEQRAVPSGCDAHRASPYAGIAGDEAGDEVLVFAGRHAVPQDHADQLVAGAFRAVPRSVLGREGAAPIVRRELAALIEREAERCRMRLD